MSHCVYTFSQTSVLFTQVIHYNWQKIRESDYFTQYEDHLQLFGCSVLYNFWDFLYGLRKSYLEEILKCMVIPPLRSEEATESFCDIIPELCC